MTGHSQDVASPELTPIMMRKCQMTSTTPTTRATAATAGRMSAVVTRSWCGVRRKNAMIAIAVTASSTRMPKPPAVPPM